MNKWIVNLMGVICIALIAVFVYITGSEDRKEPTITFPSTEVTYSEGMDKDVLLEGVTATDDKDGDVTDSVQVTAVLPLENGTQACIVYIAKDQANNVAKKERTVNYEGGQSQSPLPQEDTGANVPEGSDMPAGTEGVPASALLTDLSGTPTAEDAAAAQAAAQQDHEALPAGSPLIVLKALQVNIAVGGSFSQLEYVSSITDDKDDQDRLFRNIIIDGAYDVNTPGAYQLVYYVTDSDGNRSNQAGLTLNVVQPQVQ